MVEKGDKVGNGMQSSGLFLADEGQQVFLLIRSSFLHKGAKI